MNEVFQLIAEVGFPIAGAVVMGYFIFIIINTQRSNFMVIHHRKCFSCKSIFIYANWFFCHNIFNFL